LAGHGVCEELIGRAAVLQMNGYDEISGNLGKPGLDQLKLKPGAVLFKPAPGYIFPSIKSTPSALFANLTFGPGIATNILGFCTKFFESDFPQYLIN